MEEPQRSLWPRGAQTSQGRVAGVTRIPGVGAFLSSSHHVTTPSRFSASAAVSGFILLGSGVFLKLLSFHLVSLSWENNLIGLFGVRHST